MIDGLIDWPNYTWPSNTKLLTNQQSWLDGDRYWLMDCRHLCTCWQLELWWEQEIGSLFKYDGTVDSTKGASSSSNRGEWLGHFSHSLYLKPARTYICGRMKSRCWSEAVDPNDTFLTVDYIVRMNFSAVLSRICSVSSPLLFSCHSFTMKRNIDQSLYLFQMDKRHQIQSLCFKISHGSWTYLSILSMGIFPLFFV